jgi:hypothetical protein
MQHVCSPWTERGRLGGCRAAQMRTEEAVMESGDSSTP